MFEKTKDCGMIHLNLNRSIHSDEQRVGINSYRLRARGGCFNVHMNPFKWKVTASIANGKGVRLENWETGGRQVIC